MTNIDIEDKDLNIDLSASDFKSEWRHLRDHTQQRADLLARNDKFQQYIKELRDRFDIPPTGLDEGGVKPMIWLQKVLSPREEEWDNAIKDLMYRCNLLCGWQASLERYIKHDKFEAPPALQVIATKNHRGIPSLEIKVSD